MNFNYNHLYYFYQVAKLGGVTAAAKALRVSQPSLSLQLKTLESQTGIKLFQKSGRNLVLTEEGHRVFRISRTMFEAAEELAELSQNSDKQRTRRLTFGVDSEIERPFAAAVVGRFLRGVRPQPNVMMVSGTQNEMIDRLRGGNVDLVLASLPAYYSDVLVLSTSKVPVKFCCGKGLWSKLRPVYLHRNVSQFVNSAEVDWVLPSPRLRIRESIDSHLVRQRAIGKVVFESDIIAAVVRAVADNMGVSCLPLAYVSSEVRSGKIKLLFEKQTLWLESLYLLTRRGHEKMSSASGLAAALEAELLDMVS